MRNILRAADAAKSILRSASQRLLTPDPTTAPAIAAALDDSLDWRLDRAGRRNRAFEPTFAETSANALAFAVTPNGEGVSPRDREEIATHAMRALVGGHFGADALGWLDGRIEGLRGGTDGMGASFLAGLDRSGLSEAMLAYSWGPGAMDALPDPVFEMVRTAQGALPDLIPFYVGVRCGRQSGGLQVGFQFDRELPFDELKPLMDAFELGHQHGGLMSLLAFVLGARFSLPPNAAAITLQRAKSGIELRVDVNLDALPDAPQQLLPLLRLPMVERPRSLQALDRWMTAMTPEGYFGPGGVTVLSVRVRPDMPARLALYLRPVLFQQDAAAPRQVAEPVS
jgi:hypothetical protein